MCIRDRHTIVFVAYIGEFQAVDIGIEEFDEKYEMHHKKFSSVKEIMEFLPKAEESMSEVMEKLAEMEEQEAKKLIEDAEKALEDKKAKLAPKTKTKPKTKPVVNDPVKV